MNTVNEREKDFKPRGIVVSSQVTRANMYVVFVLSILGDISAPILQTIVP